MALFHILEIMQTVLNFIYLSDTEDPPYPPSFLIDIYQWEVLAGD